MEIIASKRFVKELRKCPINIQIQAKGLLAIASEAESIEEIPDIKKLAGYKDYYRVRLGGWRIGLQMESGIVKILYVMTIRPRGDVYKTFPPK
jgi:mRNA interferase RelE/StbE